MFASTVLRASLVLAGLLAPVLAAPTATTVMTPYGKRSSADVHRVPEGGQVRLVGNKIHLLSANGTVLHVATNDHKKVRGNGATKTDTAKRQYQTGWIAYAGWTNSGAPISSFTTSWTVPPVPASTGGQTLFWFNSIEPADGSAILQPVLQYGGSSAGGGSYYAVASWYLVGGQTYYSSLVTVDSGASLTGVITLTSTDGTNYDYSSVFTGIDGTSITATNSAQLVWATETLEVYGITDLSQFPTGSTVFSNINLETSGSVPSVQWSPTSSAADSVNCVVTTDGATNAVITIEY